MTDRQLKRLKRADLLELLLEQREENEKLKSRLRETEQQLTSQKIEISEAGSIAEAALRLNKVFEAAQKAADQYLESVKALSAGTDRTGNRNSSGDVAGD